MHMCLIKTWADFLERIRWKFYEIMFVLNAIKLDRLNRLSTSYMNPKDKYI